MDTEGELTNEEQRELLRDLRRRKLIEEANFQDVRSSQSDAFSADLNFREDPSTGKYQMSATENEDRAREAEKYLVNAIPRYARQQPADREQSNVEIPLSGVSLTSKRVCNAITRENVFHAYITNPFKEQIFKCPSVQRLYLLIKSWILQERVFKDSRQVSDQLTRYGITYISGTTQDGCETVIFSMDPYYHDKQNELIKRRNRMEQHKTTRRVALAASRLSRIRINFDKTSDEYIGGGSDDENDENESSGSSSTGIEKSFRVASGRNVIETIDQEEIPSYIDDHIRMTIIFYTSNYANDTLRGTIKEVYFSCHDVET